MRCETCGRLLDGFDVNPFDDVCDWCADDDGTMVDLGGGMVVPLREMLEDIE